MSENEIKVYHCADCDRYYIDISHHNPDHWLTSEIYIKKNPQPKGDGEQMGEELFDYKEDVDCPSYWNFRGIFFPCDLPIHHNGPHLNYPKEEGQDAVIIWSQNEPDAERRTD